MLWEHEQKGCFLIVFYHFSELCQSLQGILPGPDVSYGVVTKEKVSTGVIIKEENQFCREKSLCLFLMITVQSVRK